ncbi:NADH dehydrogenase subunit 4L (mitochondrion) [Motacilla alba]|uniref:NADH-ubiquinone oxidoreductase chain 4L n=4 Tax=Motacillidae TaxID=36256 RepID=A0A0U2X883_MOTAL|nr:NADH dehydrogenase subunit 4L [Motacilla cinerea]YP_009229160.1 NADH dehydrogenase subunit 4L [Motacilla alba]YP_010257231.1 NADH dehydrogenase subunit 4L [Dendronanthus indicus]YP_010257244.1 NADH dehydrogenase subunit 4L [Motacilla flava]AKU71453.1 NADH dehydrogenase subunit 4L [Motacilla cinerea]ALS46788.1 NADH dehydrogenase subunit 4L [Motacilla alba]QOD96077.1 NADH dehydrogenase subunit 4L [Motacilla alba]QVM19055.1 NADH dehydrogenase subunit 4L [Dendronanthus indicus]QVM19068.1 NAD
MSYLHLSFYSAFTLSTLGLAFHRTHLISALLCLESMMLSMYVALAMWPIQMQSSSSTLLPILMLTFSACEAGTGLALLVASTRTHGSDHLHNFNLLQC